MKRILMLFVNALIITNALAQTSTQINFRHLESRIERSNADILDPKKNLRAKTWTTRGELMLEAYEASILDARIGMPIIDFNIIVGKPKSQTQETRPTGEQVATYVFDRVTFTFTNNVLTTWQVNTPLVENPLGLALEAFQKALSLDSRDRLNRALNPILQRLQFRFIDEGSNCFERQDYACAFAKFSQSLEVGRMPAVNRLDTVVVYYAGLAAQLDNNYQEAITLYRQALALNFTAQGNVFNNIFECFSALNDPTAGLKYLEEGFTKYPANSAILIGIINYYLSKGDDATKALDFINLAIEREPDNISLYHAKGALLDRLGKIDEAKIAYRKAIEIDPNFFDAYFNLGVLHFNIGVKLLEVANKIPARELDRYDAKLAEANEAFKKSIPYMERCHVLRPNDRASLETLRNLYFRFRNESAEMMSNLERVNKLLDNL